MRLLLLKYNKVTNEAFLAFEKRTELDVVWGDLSQFDSKIDVLSLNQIAEYFSSLPPFDAIMVGDIFWPTGQSICQWCQLNSAKCFFLQHGQWIYTKNKKNPSYLPDSIFVYGYDLKETIESWSGWNDCSVYATGNPRYEDLNTCNGESIYFSPPVLWEMNPSTRPILHDSLGSIQAMRGLDQRCKLLIHPHYREGNAGRLRSIFPNAEFVDQGQPALPLISSSKAVLTHRNSTVVVDAIACGKRALILDHKSYFKEGHFSPFAVEVKDANDVLQNLDSDEIPFYKKKCSKHLVLGKASKRISEIIKGSKLHVRS